MKTIQMTIEEELLQEVDRTTLALHTTRSAFIRAALQAALHRHAIAALERQHAQGYAAHPGDTQELEEWRDEQEWGPV